MPEIAPILHCPACLGTAMSRVGLGPKGALQVDHCARCGGFWLEHGEVQRLRSVSQAELWSAVPRRQAPFHMRCHDCHALMERADEACPSCGWTNVLHCPACDRPMSVEAHAGLRLDVCRECKGVWFDHHEVEEIWKSSFDGSLRARKASRAGEALSTTGDVAGEVLLHSLFFAPDLVFYGARAAGQALEAGAGALANIPGAIGAGPEVAAAAVEAVGDAAGSVFEVVMSIIASIFD